MGMVVQFLCARYPVQFDFDKSTGVFHDHILGMSSEIRTIDPWTFLLENVPGDFLIVQQDKTCFYTMTAGTLLVPHSDGILIRRLENRCMRCMMLSWITKRKCDSLWIGQAGQD
jgi:hypothetical protein